MVWAVELFSLSPWWRRFKGTLVRDCEHSPLKTTGRWRSTLPIHPNILDTWTNYETGPINTAKDTHEHIRDRLEDSDSQLDDRGEMRFGTSLQGSYANHTIIHDSSDVDVLVRMDNPYKGNKQRLPSRLRERYRDEADYFDGDYSLNDFQDDVLDELEDIYGADAVERQEKAIVIDSDNCQLSLDADIVPCQQYRIYTSYNGDQHDEDTYYRGIRFETTDGTEITSFPQRHMDHGEDMNDECDGNYKETVRMFKNARDCLVRKDRLSEGDAPSYYVECLLYNVSAETFQTNDLQDRFESIVNELDDSSFQSFKAQHGLEQLFGRGETQWPTRKGMTFVDELGWLWENGT